MRKRLGAFSQFLSLFKQFLSAGTSGGRKRTNGRREEGAKERSGYWQTDVWMLNPLSAAIGDPEEWLKLQPLREQETASGCAALDSMAGRRWL